MYYLQIERGAPATITNQMLDIWGIDKNDAVNKLWDYAYKNTMEQNTPEFFNIAEKLYLIWIKMILIQAFMCYLIKTEHSGYLYCFTITQTF